MIGFADNHVHLGDVRQGDFDFPEKMLNLFADMGVTDLNLLAYMPFSNIVQNLDVLYWKSAFKRSKIRAFGSFHEADIYKDISYEEQLEKLLSLGFDGIKFIQMKPDRIKFLGKTLADESYDAALSRMEELGTPAIIHSGDPSYFWDYERMPKSFIDRGWYYGDRGYMSPSEIYGENFKMLKKHPKLNVVFAHLFFLSEDIDEARRVLLEYPNVKYDLAPGWQMFLDFTKDIDRWRDFFIEFSDRILFGTDASDGKSVNRELNEDVMSALTHDRTDFVSFKYYGHLADEGEIRIKGLELPSEVVDKICYKNCVDFVGEPKDVNMSLLRFEAEKMLEDIKDDEKNKNSVEWLSELLKRI